MASTNTDERIDASEILPESNYQQIQALSRRELLQALGLGAIAMSPFASVRAENSSPSVGPLLRDPRFASTEELTTWEDASSYNNYYEFGLDKGDPKVNAATFSPLPWQVEIAGLCERKGVFDLDEILRDVALEERVYRHRCVEAWSMVLPWVGVPLAAVLKKFKPLAAAKYVAFTTLHDPKRMPGQRSRSLDWPYREGLRMDEAMHPLTLLATGMYGRMLPNQNGAPLRLVVPWKYGFKGIKGIVKIEFRERQPYTSWNDSAPEEYGFFANVNPAVDHPRWSQATERKLTGSGFSLFRTKRVKTLPFNGYAASVASIYQGMDLAQYF